MARLKKELIMWLALVFIVFGLPFVLNWLLFFLGETYNCRMSFMFGDSSFTMCNPPNLIVELIIALFFLAYIGLVSIHKLLVVMVFFLGSLVVFDYWQYYQKYRHKK